MSRITKAKETQSKMYSNPCKQYDDVRNHKVRNTSAVLQLCRTLGNQAMLSLSDTGIVQCKLTVGKSNDKYEQEADRIAEMIMRMPSPNFRTSVQRKKEEEKEKARTKHPIDNITPVVQQHSIPDPDTPPINPDIEKGIRSLKGNGRPLSKRERDFFEPWFGVDFSNVRIHTGDFAAESTKDLNAHAYTVGNDVVMGDGKYSPGSKSGKKLLGHELVHVVQQISNSPSPSSSLISRNMDDIVENAEFKEDAIKKLDDEELKKIAIFSKKNMVRFIREYYESLKVLGYSNYAGLESDFFKKHKKRSNRLRFMRKVFEKTIFERIVSNLEKKKGTLSKKEKIKLRLKARSIAKFMITEDEIEPIGCAGLPVKILEGGFSDTRHSEMYQKIYLEALSHRIIKKRGRVGGGIQWASLLGKAGFETIYIHPGFDPKKNISPSYVNPFKGKEVEDEMSYPPPSAGKKANRVKLDKILTDQSEIKDFINDQNLVFALGVVGNLSHSFAVFRDESGFLRVAEIHHIFGPTEELLLEEHLFEDFLQNKRHVILSVPDRSK